MSMGLRVWDSGGNLILDSNQRISRIVFEGYLTLAPNADNLINVPGLQANSNWSAQCQAYTPTSVAHLTTVATSLQTDYVLIRLENVSINIPAKLIVYRF